MIGFPGRFWPGVKIKESKPRTPISGLQSYQSKPRNPSPGLQTQEIKPRNELYAIELDCDACDPSPGLQSQDSKPRNPIPKFQTQEPFRKQLLTKVTNFFVIRCWMRSFAYKPKSLKYPFIMFGISIESRSPSSKSIEK